MKQTLMLRIVFIVLACASETVLAGPIPVFPQSPYANVSSYGATQNQYNFNTNYIYGPLTDSSSGAPVSVGSTSSCTTGCVYSGATSAYGTAHAAGGGDMGVSSSIIAPDNTAANPYTDPVFGDSHAAFGNSLVVQSALDPAGNPIWANNTPVQLGVTMRLDGNMDLFASDLQKASSFGGGYVSSSDVSGEFTLYDPNVVYASGESAGIPINLISFNASASGNNASKYDYTKSKYVAEQSAGYNWSLTSNAGANLSKNWSFSCDGYTQICDSSSSGALGAYTNSPLGFNFDTGMLNVTLDTYIGATLDWDASMYVFNQAYGPTAHSYSDFSHTFGVNLNPVTSGVNLSFSQQQIPLTAPSPVPEPPAIDVLAPALLLVLGYAGHRRHA